MSHLSISRLQGQHDDRRGSIGFSNAGALHNPEEYIHLLKVQQAKQRIIHVQPAVQRFGLHVLPRSNSSYMVGHKALIGVEKVQVEDAELEAGEEDEES